MSGGLILSVWYLVFLVCCTCWYFCLIMSCLLSNSKLLLCERTHGVQFNSMITQFCTSTTSAKWSGSTEMNCFGQCGVMQLQILVNSCSHNVWSWSYDKCRGELMPRGALWSTVAQLNWFLFVCVVSHAMCVFVYHQIAVLLLLFRDGGFGSCSLSDDDAAKQTLLGGCLGVAAGISGLFLC